MDWSAGLRTHKNLLKPLVPSQELKILLFLVQTCSTSLTATWSKQLCHKQTEDNSQHCTQRHNALCPKHNDKTNKPQIKRKNKTQQNNNNKRNHDNKSSPWCLHWVSHLYPSRGRLNQNRSHSMKGKSPQKYQIKVQISTCYSPGCSLTSAQLPPHLKRKEWRQWASHMLQTVLQRTRMKSILFSTLTLIRHSFSNIYTEQKDNRDYSGETIFLDLWRQIWPASITKPLSVLELPSYEVLQSYKVLLGCNVESPPWKFPPSHSRDS